LMQRYFYRIPIFLLVNNSKNKYHLLFEHSFFIFYFSLQENPRCVWPLLVSCLLSSVWLFLHDTLMEPRIKTKNIIVMVAGPSETENYHSLSRVVVPATLHSISGNAHFTRFV
jgi:hypothetical protein